MRSFGSGSAIFLLTAGLAEALEAAVTLEVRGLSVRSALGLGQPLSASNTGNSGAHDLWTRSTARASPGAPRTSKTHPFSRICQKFEALAKFVTLASVSIETLSRTVPPEQRADFLARAARLVQRAEVSRASSTELELALGVLSVLCGAANRAADPAQGAEQ